MWIFFFIGPMTIIEPKCYVMSVGNINDTNPNYKLDNKQLATSTCVKDLGIWIDDKLKFHEHTSVTIAKACNKKTIIGDLPF